MMNVIDFPQERRSQGGRHHQIMGPNIPLIYDDQYRTRMAADKICSSCGKRLVGHGNTFFKCPKCGEYEIGRCDQCRDQGVSYECKKCGFIGP